MSTIISWFMGGITREGLIDVGIVYLFWLPIGALVYVDVLCGAMLILSIGNDRLSRKQRDWVRRVAVALLLVIETVAWHCFVFDFCYKTIGTPLLIIAIILYVLICCAAVRFLVVFSRKFYP